MTLPAVSKTLQFFRECSTIPNAAIVVGHHGTDRVDLYVFPDHWTSLRGNHASHILFVPLGEDPPDDEAYCSFPPETVSIPANVSVT